MKSLPKFVDILGVRFKVRQEKGMAEKGYDGLCIPDKKIILIEASYTNREKWEILWHEQWHAFSTITGINQTMDKQAEEMIAQCFATWMVNK